MTDTVDATVASLPPGHVEGQVVLRVKMTPELMAQWATRDVDGYLLRWDWGKPDHEGFYTPTVTRDKSDRL